MTRRTYLFGNIEQILTDIQWEHEKAARLEASFYDWLLVHPVLKYRVEGRSD
jgi:hypothetical protein